MKCVLQVTEVRKAYGETQALAGVDLAIREGEVYALLGTNGAGKTTLFRILMDIHLADGGAVTWNLGEGPRARLVGYLPEERGLQQDVPIERTLTFLGRLRGLDKGAARRATGQWLERMGLSDRSDDKLDTLSKGNQQKVQIAAALLHEPRFALLDEPFSGFDPVNQELLLELIGELTARGTTVLFSAHQLELVERICDRVGLLHGGQLASEGTLQELRKDATREPRLRLELVDAADHERVAEDPHVEQVEQQGDGTCLVVLRGGTRLSEALASLSGNVALNAITVVAPSLHDLYMGTVRGTTGRSQDA